MACLPVVVLWAGGSKKQTLGLAVCADVRDQAWLQATEAATVPSSYGEPGLQFPPDLREALPAEGRCRHSPPHPEVPRGPMKPAGEAAPHCRKLAV